MTAAASSENNTFLFVAFSEGNNKAPFVSRCGSHQLSEITHHFGLQETTEIMGASGKPLTLHYPPHPLPDPCYLAISGESVPTPAADDLSRMIHNIRNNTGCRVQHWLRSLENTGRTTGIGEQPYAAAQHPFALFATMCQRQ